MVPDADRRILVFVLMTTWKRGRQLVIEKQSAKGLNLDLFIESLMHDPRTG
jgi:K+ transporter